MPRTLFASLLGFLACFSACDPNADPSAKRADKPQPAPQVVPPVNRDIIIHPVESPYQSGKTQIKVLLPDDFSPSGSYPVVYVLPVEAGNENRYGDGLAEIKERGLHHTYGAIFVAPTFSQLPWYADHPTDPAIQQEKHFIEFVLPFVERTYPARANASGRLLLGFSKSGWGAWSLLLRHPDLFGRAAAWDAPLMMARTGLYGSGPIFGTQENFEKYHVSALLRKNAKTLEDTKPHNLEKRFVMTGYGNFHQEHQQMAALLGELKIPFEYRDGPERKHDWHSGWVAEAVELLFAMP